MSSSSKFLKVCLKLVLLLSALRFFIAEAHGARRIRAAGSRVMNRDDVGNTKQDFVVGVDMAKMKRRVHSKLKVNYVSKRKVPNGPDPIHNRAAGKSHRPPGHA